MRSLLAPAVIGMILAMMAATSTSALEVEAAELAETLSTRTTSNPAAKKHYAAKMEKHRQMLEAGEQRGSKYHHFLKYNRLPSGQPLSYTIEPTNYFKKVPDNEKLHHYNHSYTVPACGADYSANATEMNDYMFQTETLLTALGLDIYDAAVWSTAMGILGDTEIGYNYTKVYLMADSDSQFTNIRGDAPCKGVMAWGQCTDPNQAGVCGFCYGLGAESLTNNNAYFFRMISSYWSIEGTVDARCPEKKIPWTWNDYRPILGENAWAQLTGPAHNAMMRANNSVSAIPADAPIFSLGISFLDALEAMTVGTTGGIFYEPWNTWDGFSKAAEDVAESFSIENQGSALAGLRALYYLIDQNPSSPHKSHLPRIKTLMAGLQKILLASWNNNAENPYFQQGGTYNHTTQKLAWYQGTSPGFAVDCQTWVSAVLGVKVVDGAFGELASYNLWQTVKKFAGYYQGGYLYGVGYTFNSYGGPVFSGEWTYGAINWLRTMVNQSDYNATIISDLKTDIENMVFGLEESLETEEYVANSTHKYSSILYANKRYYIPFGWWANHLPALCSTGWAVMVDNEFNPFNVDGGSYAHTTGMFDENLLCSVEGERGTGKPLDVKFLDTVEAELKKHRKH